MYDIIIVGAGVSGAFIARELSKYELKVLVIEKENDVGNGASNANSAIVHAGYDPLPGSLKAQLNVKGASLYPRICEELDVTFNKIGSLVVAINPEEADTVKELYKRGIENKVNVSLLDKAQLLKLEPRLNDDVILGLFASDAGVIDPFNLVVHCFENAIDNGVILHRNEVVEGIKSVDDHYEIYTNKDTYKTKIVINASGVEADAINNFILPREFDILPNKGEYFVLDHFDNDFLHHVIFPTPSKKGKGILMTPTSSNNYLIGPSSTLIEDKYGVDTDELTLDEVKKKVQTLIKDIPFNQVIRTFSGVRPRSTSEDFIINMKKFGFINVAGIESPGLASAPALGEYVVETFVKKCMELKEKEFNPYVKKYIIPKKLPLSERDEVIKNNKLYGKLICRCEQVSEQEIIDVLSRSCPPFSIKGVKKRTRAGFGKCQGGICQPLVAQIMAKFYDVPLTSISYDNVETPIVIKETKVQVNNNDN